MRCFQTGRLRLLCGAMAFGLFISPVLADTTYTVKAGDSLSKLAIRFSVPLQDLLELNHLKKPNKILVGQVLTIPDRTSAPTITEEPTAEAEAAPQADADVNLMPEASRSSNPRELAEGRARLLASQGNNVVDAAKNYLGTPYRWAGTSSRGIDCSGLVMRSMAVLGKDVPHNAAALYKMGSRVSYAELLPGDLVFFNTNGRSISHVGIWVGDNRFIHASTSRGVVVDKMAGYFSRRLVGARRIN